MKTILPDETYFHGAISFEKADDYIRPWRIPFEEIVLHEPFGNVPDKAGRTAGVRLRFKTNSPIIELVAELKSEALPLIDLVCDNEIISTHGPAEHRDIFRFQGLGDQERIYEILLPVFAYSYIKSLSVADGATLEAAPDGRVRWMSYGSSITQCRASHSPARAWPATAARKLDLDLTCLGYGGNCHLEPLIGIMMRDRPADIITLKLGINVYGGGSLSMRTFRCNAIGLVKLIREKQPNVPIGLITPIYSCDRETKPNAVGLTLVNYREQLRAAYEALKSLGDDKLFIFEGRDLLWEEDAGLMPDNLHPNGEGYELMGVRAAEKILPTLLDAR